MTEDPDKSSFQEDAGERKRRTTSDDDADATEEGAAPLPPQKLQTPGLQPQQNTQDSLACDDNGSRSRYTARILPKIPVIQGGERPKGAAEQTITAAAVEEEYDVAPGAGQSATRQTANGSTVRLQATSFNGAAGEDSPVTGCSSAPAEPEDISHDASRDVGPTKKSQLIHGLVPGAIDASARLVATPDDHEIPPMTGGRKYVTSVTCPGDNDVLIGVGYDDHQGNQKFKALIADQFHNFSTALDKRSVCRGIVRAIRAQNPPGRFLKPTTDNENASEKSIDLEKNRRVWNDVGDDNAAKLVLVVFTRGLGAAKKARKSESERCRTPQRHTAASDAAVGSAARLVEDGASQHQSNQPKKRRRLSSGGVSVVSQQPRVPPVVPLACSAADSPAVHVVKQWVAHLALADVAARTTCTGVRNTEILMREQCATRYFDAGILGIDPNEMALQISRGVSEEDIVANFVSRKNGDLSEKEPEHSTDESSDANTISINSFRNPETLVEQWVSEALNAINGGDLLL